MNHKKLISALLALALILSEAIEQGHLIGIMADRCAQGERRMSVDFLGEQAQCPAGVWQLAALLKAPVISCFGIYSGAKPYQRIRNEITYLLYEHQDSSHTFGYNQHLATIVFYTKEHTSFACFPSNENQI